VTVDLLSCRHVRTAEETIGSTLRDSIPFATQRPVAQQSSVKGLHIIADDRTSWLHTSKTSRIKKIRDTLIF
jgi:hypothetical protein